MWIGYLIKKQLCGNSALLIKLYTLLKISIMNKKVFIIAILNTKNKTFIMDMFI